MKNNVLQVMACVLFASVYGVVAHAESSSPEARPAPRDVDRLEGVFLAAEDELSLYFSLESGAEGEHFRRRAEFVWTDEAGQFTRVYEDVAKGQPWAAAFPSPPAEMPMESLSDGSFLMSFPAPAGWEERMSAHRKSATKRSDRPRVADERSARLLIVTQFEGVAPQGGNHAAVLYGTKAHVEGTVWLRKAEMNPERIGEPSPVSSWVVWRDPGSIRAQTLETRSTGLAPHFVLGVRAGCERMIPQSLLVTLPEPVRLVTSSDPACFSSGKSVSQAAGVRIENNAFAEVRGLVIWH